MNEESIRRAASRMEDAATNANRSADRIEEYTRQMQCLLEDGYGGNGSILVELLTNNHKAAVTALMAIKELIIKGDYSDERALELIADGIAGKN